VASRKGKSKDRECKGAGRKPSRRSPAQRAVSVSVGRPTDYDPQMGVVATKLCRLGAVDREIAEFFGVAESTLNLWKLKHPEFSESLKAGKDAFDERVERALGNRAVGYTFDSEKIMQFEGGVIRAKTVEHVPPDVTAAIFWLKNRRRDRWGEKPLQPPPVGPGLTVVVQQAIIAPGGTAPPMKHVEVQHAPPTLAVAHSSKAKLCDG
jgi:hypothetical protein